jgi:hypothetical protein
LSGIEKEVLLAPQHPGQCLPHHIGLVCTGASGGYRLIERVGLLPALFYDLIELAAEVVNRHSVAEPQGDHGGRACADIDLVVCGGLGPRLAPVDGIQPA